MAARKSIKLAFAEKAITAAIRDNQQPGAELWIYDRGGKDSVGGLLLWVDQHGNEIYQILKKIGGKLYRRNLGTRQGLSVSQARDDAAKLIQTLKAGIDPKLETAKQRQIEALQGLTFEQALEQCLEGDYAEATRTKYRQALEHTFADCKGRPLPWFTPERVREIHAKRSRESKSAADHDMRVLRLVWNWARQQHRTEAGEEILGPHPVTVLNKRSRKAGEKGWNALPPKERTVPKKRLPDWFGALYEIREEPGVIRTRRTSALLLELLALTGLRFNEAAKLTRVKTVVEKKLMPHVDWAHGLIVIPDTSAKGRQAINRPITKRVREILEALPEHGAYYFAGRNKGKEQPLNATGTVKLQHEIESRTGLWITPHDLRRLWASAASRAGVPQHAIKRLMAHAGRVGDVTQGYQVAGLDELLDYSQAVEDQILKDAGLLQADPDELFNSLTPQQKQRLLELAQQEAQA